MQGSIGDLSLSVARLEDAERSTKLDRAPGGSLSEAMPSRQGCLEDKVALAIMRHQSYGLVELVDGRGGEELKVRE